MSNFLGPANVTASLRMVLENLVAETGIGFQVTTVRPDQVPNPDQAKINLFLFQVTPNTQWRNHDVPTRTADGEVRQRPRLAVDLHYLITFYGDENLLEAQRLMASTARVMHQQPWLTTDWLAAAQGSPLFPFLAGSDIEEENERVKFTPTTLSVEELGKLWAVFPNTPYNLSLTYSASVVFIEEELRTVDPMIVLQRQVGALTVGVGAPLPSSIPGLGLWLRSDRGLSGSHVAGTSTPPEFDWEWLDQSGHGRHATQRQDATGVMPRLVPHAAGPMPALQFDGANDFMNLAWTLDGSVHAVTVCIVHRTTVGGRQGILSFDPAVFWELGSVQNPAIGLWATAGGSLNWTAIPANPYHPVQAAVQLGQRWRAQYATFQAGPSTTSELWLESLRVATDAVPGTNPLGGAARTGVLGATAGAAGPTGNFFQGQLAEVIVFERALNEAERASLFRYLSDRYGIP